MIKPIILSVALFFSNQSLSNESFVRLDTVNIFSIGNNGFIGEISDGEKIYKKESKKESAYNFFISIANNEKSTPESKLYAACYLKERYPKKSLGKNKKTKVSVLKGDVLRVYYFYDIYNNILKNGCN
ncbi:hypothetical protein H9A57_004592 [Salmonella enterica]|nr:hypothetical protein [Salmonella enterica]EGH3757450.1 hypothetical protein [Salmonella enterica]EIM6766242.1 hypothetical protein [Salmonella enterica]